MSGNENGEGNKYSFSTNAIGYVRFLSDTQQVKFIGYKSLYTLIYILLVIINVFAVLCMFVRFIMLILLSIAGPIIAVAQMFKSQKVFNMTYQEWAIKYFQWSSIQIIISIAYRIILEVCF